MTKKDTILFITIFCVLALIAGSTYAYWGWSSNESKSVVFNTSKGIEDYVIYDEGDSHFVGDFKESITLCDGISTEISVGLNTADMSADELDNFEKHRLIATINMDINSIGSALSASDALKWAVVDTTYTSIDDFCANNSQYNTLLNHGSFNGLSGGTEVELTSLIPVTADIRKYSVVIWLDSSSSSLESLSNETLDVNVWTRIDSTDNSVCRIYYNERGYYMTRYAAIVRGYAFYQDIEEGQPFLIGQVTGGEKKSDGTYELPNGDCIDGGSTVQLECGSIIYISEGLMCFD